MNAPIAFSLKPHLRKSGRPINSGGIAGIGCSACKAKLTRWDIEAPRFKQRGMFCLTAVLRSTVPNTEIVNKTLASYTNFPHLRIDFSVTVGVN